MRLFRYSGSKHRYLKHYRRPPVGTKRIVEPYLGSGTYWLSSDLPGLGYEVNGDLVAMWKWLQGCRPDDLRDLESDLRALKVKYPVLDKPDVRLMNLSLGPQTYVRINVTSVMVGQLTSWKIYPKNTLPIGATIGCLPRLKDIEIIHGSANEYVHRDGDLLFVDPPYLGTTAGYLEKTGRKNHEKVYEPRDTVRLIDSTSNPVVFTYGDGATDTFPAMSWEHVASRKVPNVRKGGTIDRSEWVSYVRW